MSFHEERFPTAVSFGATGGPERKNEIVRLVSGREKRNARAAHSRRRYDAGTGLRSVDDLQDVVAFFEARRGSLHGFRFRDPFDWKSCRVGQTVTAVDQPIGAGTGGLTIFQLAKTYGTGVDAYKRPIGKPVAGTVKVAVAGVELAPAAFAVNVTTGVVTLVAAPANGAAVTAGYEFDVPVRFDADALSVSLAAFKAGEIPSIPLIEIILETP